MYTDDNLKTLHADYVEWNTYPGNFLRCLVVSPKYHSYY